MVGGLCLAELLEDAGYGRVIVLARRPLTSEHPKLTQHVVDFARPDGFADKVEADDVFSCVGTTRGKAQSEADYRRIDFDIPLNVARLAAARGAKQFLLVSSVGADAGSRVFYTRLKGELEDSVSALPFEAAHLFRPSFLLGERGEDRPAERVMLRLSALLSALMVGPLRRWRAVPGKTVAKAMVAAALSGQRGRRVYEFDAICRSARQDEVGRGLQRRLP